MVLRLVPLNSDCFVDIFLKRYLPTSKTIRLRDEILSFVQFIHKPFSRSMNRFEELLF